MAHYHGDISLDLILNESIDLSKLPDEDRHRIEHARMHEKHRGHEKMHSYMILILLASVVIAQIILVNWKKLHFKSYQRVTMVGMWLIPLCISVHSYWWRFVFIWTIFTVGTFIVMSWALQKPIAGTTPRWVYKWFYVIYLQSCAVCVFGYVVVMLTLLGVNVVFRAKPQSWMDVGLLFLFYGMYYGVLGRDVSEAVTDRMACTIGYYTTTGVPKQTCPYCKEKVDLKRMFCSPWEKPHILYGNFLDFIRYLLVWQPVIIMAVQFLNSKLGLE
ncbi:hypothetical protein MRX96_022762 [Rhipicephalus microplus]